MGRTQNRRRFSTKASETVENKLRRAGVRFAPAAVERKTKTPQQIFHKSGPNGGKNQSSKPLLQGCPPRKRPQAENRAGISGGRLGQHYFECAKFI